ncbi:hypothetical protein NLU13_6842 [Sarocladium strictum]|uniref:LysM domain-containing protein n=1 Tax=Sarocladium strictum TaxID=5046 RepID=A0AA39GE58_SARSR|nr:hypothetical protein NLU13_6842 [Sarocladium strictum]
MKLIHLLASSLAFQCVESYLVTPDGVAAPGSNTDCSSWIQASYEMTCEIIELYYNLSEAQFEEWNPSTADQGVNCTLIDSLYYCVDVSFASMHTGFPTSLSTLSPSNVVPPTISVPATTLKTVTATATGDGISTPSPIQTGMVANCNKFHLVVSGDTCGDIATAAGISLGSFYAWNPAVGGTCTLLLLGDYVCVGVIGSAVPTSTSTAIKATTSTSTSTKPATSTSTKATTTTGNGISTPSPIQTGMVSNCNKFHLVVSGDTCSQIATTAGISLANFYAWNPAVGSTCNLLLLGDYVCIGVLGSPTRTTTTSSKPTGNGISTPSPIQTGMASNCDKFHLVVSGDTCSAITTAAGVSLTSFYAWNPAVGSTCAALLLGDYVCIGVAGSVAPTKTTKTTTGNGVATPTPIQTGMVTNCDKFHLVVSGDGCSAIATAAGISLSSFYAWNPAVGTSCATLFLGYYVCIGIL